MTKPTTSNQYDPRFLSILAELILISLGKNIGKLLCVPLETFNNIVSALERIEESITKELKDKWKTYILRHTPIGLRLEKIEGKIILWNEYLIKCRDIHALREQLDIHTIIDTDIQELLKEILAIIPAKDTAGKFITFLKLLFKLKLNAKMFKHVLKSILRGLLPNTCIVEIEYPLATGMQPDLYLECPNLAIALEIKSTQEGTHTTASHNPLTQLTQYINGLKALHNNKHTAAILVRTDGKTPLEVIAEAARTSIDKDVRQSLHILSETNLDAIFSQARKIAAREKRELTLHELLTMITKGRIDTIKLATKNT